MHEIAALFVQRRSWFILLGLVILATAGWWSWRSWQRQTPLGPQRTVVSANPKIGVHTRLTDEVEAWKIKRSFEMVREMGAPWAVEYFPWAYVEPQKGRFSWNHTDLVINHATRQGVTLVARLGFAPAWARPPQTSPLYLDEQHMDDFGLFAAEFTKRYAEQVHYIILWNEPNLNLEWGYQPAQAESYVRLLEIVTPMVKAANPQVEILAGALAPTFNSEWGVNDLDFLQQMYDHGAQPYFDILAVHAYGWHLDPDDPPDPAVINFRRTELLHQIMQRNGDGDKPLMITEGGWNDHPRWTRAVRPAQRIAYTLRAYTIAAEEWPWLMAVCFWAFRYPWDVKSYQDYYTFVGVDFEPKPVYLEVQRYALGN
jgi:hypothetical protein